jgi:hypothetical protein
MARLSRGSIDQTPFTQSNLPIRAGNGTLQYQYTRRHAICVRHCLWLATETGPENRGVRAWGCGWGGGGGAAHDAVPDRSLFSETPLRC